MRTVVTVLALLHTIVAATAQPAPRPELAAYVPLTSYRGFVLTARDVPVVFEDERLIKATTNLVAFEQTAWARLARALEPAGPGRWRLRQFNQDSERFVYEWQTIAAAGDQRRRDDLLALFLRPERQLPDVLDVFLFAKASVDGRERRFAAQELAPVYKQHLELAAKNADTHLWLSVPLPNYDYDFSAKAIRFLAPGAGATFTDAIALMQMSRQGEMQLPPRTASTANYSLMGSVVRMRNADAPAAKPDSPTVAWRSGFQSGSSDDTFPMVEWLAFDRQLRLPASLAMDAKEAEQFVKRKPELSARIYFDAERVELAEQVYNRKLRLSAVLFARINAIDVLDPDGQVLVSYGAAALPPPPDAAAVATAGASAAAARASAAAAAAAERKQRRDEQIAARRQRSLQNKTVEQQRAQDSAKERRCARHAATETKSVTGNMEKAAREKHPAYQKVFTACMAVQ